MMVGGIMVCGLYVVSQDNSSATTTAAAAVKHAMEGLQHLWPSSGDAASKIRSLVLLHMSAHSRQITVRTCPPKGELSAVEGIKYQEKLAATKFVTYQSMLEVDFSFAAPPLATTSTKNFTDVRQETEFLVAEDAFYRRMLKAIRTEGALLEKARAFPHVSLLQQQLQEQQMKQQQQQQQPNLGGKLVDFYTVAFDNGSSSKVLNRRKEEEHRPVHVRGNVACVASVLEKEGKTVGVQALREDFVRSLRDRVHLLREEGANEVEEVGPEAVLADPATLCHAIHEEGGGTLRIPRRVLLPLASSLSFFVADYILPGEKEEDAKARLEDAFGVNACSTSSSPMIVLEKEGAVVVDVPRAPKASPQDNNQRRAGRNSPSVKTVSTGLQKHDTAAVSSLSLYVSLSMVGVGVLLIVAAAVLYSSRKM